MQSLITQATQHLKLALPPLSSADIESLTELLWGFTEMAELDDIPLPTITQKFIQLQLPDDPFEHAANGKPCYEGSRHALCWYYAWGFSESLGKVIKDAHLPVRLRVYSMYLYVLTRDERYDDENAAYMLYRLLDYALEQAPDIGIAMADYLQVLLVLCAPEKPDRHAPHINETIDFRHTLRLAITILAVKFTLPISLEIGSRNGLDTYLEGDYLSHYFWDKTYYHSDSWLHLLNQSIDNQHPQFEALTMWVLA